MYFILKVLISAILIALISELSKRSQVAAAILASVPLVSVLAILWVYVGNHNTTEVATLSHGIFWMVLPSLVFFISLPVLLKYNVPFYIAMLASLAIMVACYFAMIFILKKAGITL
jgi:hypothetical protein